MTDVNKGSIEREFDHRAGELRPSQIIYTYGPGSIVDLPAFSAVVLDGDKWADYGKHLVIDEPRLLEPLRRLGPYRRLQELRTAPIDPEHTGKATDKWATTGVSVEPFPRWFRCLMCGRLLNVDSTREIEFKYSSNYRPDQHLFIHTNCQQVKNQDNNEKVRDARCVPVRFVVACENGHLDEFPWITYAHGGAVPSGNSCELYLKEGSGVRATDMRLHCETCKNASGLKGTSMIFAFSPNYEEKQCSGYHPHSDRIERCEATARPMMLGASNIWFPLYRSVLSLPLHQQTGTGELLHAFWDRFEDLEDEAELKTTLKQLRKLDDPRARLLVSRLEGDPVSALDVVRAHQSGGAVAETVDLLEAEFRLFSQPPPVPEGKDFLADVRREPPVALPGLHTFTTVERLREVAALYGFTRLTPPGDAGQAFTPVVRSGKWVPVSVVRGEGIFIRFPDGAEGAPNRLSAWEEAAAHDQRAEKFHEAHRLFLERRRAEQSPWPGVRYLMLHTFSHAVINQLALECGYATASLRERIYCSPTAAGVLLYTSAPDSEGTLGGLMSLVRSKRIDQIVKDAIERLEFCSGDPLCAKHEPTRSEEDVLHGAACHYCLFLPETSCERQNRFLDRAALLSSVGGQFAYRVIA